MAYSTAIATHSLDRKMSIYLKPKEFGASDYLPYKSGVIWYEGAGKFHARTSGNLGVFSTVAAAKAAITRYEK